ncbi:MAG: protein translocase subunit SecF, partial [Caulobacteraceae bacterium]
MAWPLIKLLPTHTHFKFVRLAPFAAIFSALLIVGSCVSFFTQGLNLGIDFKGGTLIEVVTPGTANLSNLRNELGRIGVRDAQVQGFGAPNAAMLRFRPTENGSAVDEVERIKQSLSKTTPGIVFKRVEVVGPKVSGELFKSGFVALGIAIALMLLYIWFRFQLQFGLGAVIAVFHDIVLTLGLLSVLQIEFAMTSIAALLTVIGYSMNEKVITFDRLRENLRKFRKMPLRDVIDLSENERLSRTLITGSTALLALSGMLFLGGPALFPLIITMMFGILIGTYSSVYVALPVILLWGVRRNDEAEPKGKPVTARP